MSPTLQERSKATRPYTPATRQARSRNGCWTCRGRKVKCDEGRPQCQRCDRLNLLCDYQPRPRKKYTKRSAQRCSPVLSYSSASEIPRDEATGAADVTSSPDASGTWDPVDSSPASRRGTSDFDGDDGGRPQSPLVEGCLLSHSLDTINPTDEKAIECYRTMISSAVDTKDQEYSVPTIIWEMSKMRPMILHMICALGSRQLCHQISSQGKQTEYLQGAAMRHYGESMRLLAGAIHDTSESSLLDATLATLWLMIIYEQRFGDGWGEGLNTHLRGAASVLTSRLGNLRNILNWDEQHGLYSESTSPRPETPGASASQWRISPFAGRMIIWISFLDAAAAFNGFGGDFNKSLNEVMTGLAEDTTVSWLRGFSCIHRYSTHMCSETWGDAYPQEQLFEDLENRQLLYLYGQTGQLRYILSQLSKVARDHDDPSQTDLGRSAARALRVVAEKYSELIEVAPQLDFHMAKGREKKFIINARFIIPNYHAIVLCHFRITRRHAPANSRQVAALQQIISLAYRSYADEGENAMARVAWPLFVAALETTDLVHRDWILARFANLQERGENYRRAYAALRTVCTETRQPHAPTDCLDILSLSSVDKFVI